MPNRVDGCRSDDRQCASHTTVRTGLVYGGSIMMKQHKVTKYALYAIGEILGLTPFAIGFSGLPNFSRHNLAFLFNCSAPPKKHT